MAQGDVTKWLTSHGEAEKLTVPLAKNLARELPLGWYVAPYANGRFCVGKLTLEKFASRHIVTDEDEHALTFATIDEAKTFLRDELAVLAPQIYDY